jgi:hypothetical protein
MNNNNLTFPVITFLISITAIVLQFYFAIVYWTQYGLTVIGSIGQYFSYYTILKNILASISIFAALSKKKSLLRNIFLQKRVLFGINVNLVFVGIAYSVLLRNLWTPNGLQFIVNEVLHSLMPVLFLIFIFLYRTDVKLKWRSVFNWQLYPVTYAIIIMVRGKVTGLYPYPFLDVNNLGFSKVLLNILLLLLCILILSLIFLFVDRVIGVRKKMVIL